MNPRYAIYFVPAADSALYRFGAAMLGYDCYTGNDVGFPDPLPMEHAAWRDLTGEPRRYGFHATLKAPFQLANGGDETELVDAFQHFSRSIEAVPIFEPIVATLQGFVAIVPSAANPAIDRLAAACVTSFDRFRAPLSAHDRDRRTIGLSERQTGNLDRWGYPFVFDDFRLHLTLTGRLGADRRPRFCPFSGNGSPPHVAHDPCRSIASHCCGRTDPTHVSTWSATRRSARPGSNRCSSAMPIGDLAARRGLVLARETFSSAPNGSVLEDFLAR